MENCSANDLPFIWFANILKMTKIGSIKVLEEASSSADSHNTYRNDLAFVLLIKVIFLEEEV